MVTHKNFVGGDWVPGSAATLDVNPSDLSDSVGEFAMADVAQVDAAVDAALTAAPSWAAASPAARFAVLEKVGIELAGRADELGTQLSREEGKPRSEGIAEVLRASWIFKFFAGEALRMAGEHIRSVRPGVDVDVLREPLGVVGVITPWNFPFAIPAWKIAPALAFGNPVIFKPAQLVPASAWSLAEILSRAGLPPGAFNLVIGSGGVVGDRLIRHAGVRGITFTGSQTTGRQVALACAERFAKAQLEMGGKNPLVILDDADLGVAVDCAVQGAFFQTGQRCTASSRLIVTAGIHDRFVEATVAAMKELRVGHALEESTQIGPVVDESQFRQDEGYLEIGRDEGATLAWGGERLERDTDGYYLSPALLVDTTNDMRVNREESLRADRDRREGRGRRGGSCRRERHRVRPISGGVHHLAEERRDVPRPPSGRHRHREPADGRCRFPRPVRRDEGLESGEPRARTLRGRVLHTGQDGLRSTIARCCSVLLSPSLA